LCSRTIRFIIKADRKEKFIFQTLQSNDESEIPDTVIVIDKLQTYQYFDAVLKIGKELGGIYSTIIVFKLLPQSWSHWLYLFVARNRLNWFGKNKTCFVPSDAEKKRFI
jgi:predicted DCC family thiol-disulfide oxidoreductase YuxK